MKRQTIKRLVRLLLSFGRPLRGRFSIRTHATIRPPPQRQHFPTTATAAFPAIQCRCGRRVVGRRSRPGHLRLRRSHFAMSSILPKFISLIIKDIHLKTCWTRHISLPNGHSAPYLHRSSRCFFSECLIIRYFCKRTLLDVRYTSTPEV